MILMGPFQLEIFYDSVSFFLTHVPASGVNDLRKAGRQSFLW